MDITITYLVDGEQFVSDGTDGEHFSLKEVHDGERTRVTISPVQRIVLKKAVIIQPHEYKEGSRVFLNGYQSWTDTREYALRDELHDVNRVPDFLLKRFHFRAYGDAWFRDYKKGWMHGFTFAYIKEPGGNTDLIGSLNEENAYLVINCMKKSGRVYLESDCEGKVVTEEFTLFDYVHYSGDTREVIQRYFANYDSCGAAPVRGYTSWYNYYQDIDEDKIIKNLDALNPDEFELFQIDDGFETFVGDWLDIDPAKFPNGLEEIVKKIHAKGLLAGLWLAPFVCETKSRIYREHPDWLYRENGKEVFAGSNWSGDVVLDIRKPEVMDYIGKCLTYYREMGFDFFKLDFLYAAAMIREGNPMTRAETMRMGMKALRSFLPDEMILGCGVPLSSAFGLVDYCRIGPDVSLIFDDVRYMRLMHRERISTKVTIQNTIFRACMDGTVFRCDPDVFLLRDDNIKLSKEQRRALVMINHLCGSVYMTSDNVGEYDNEKKKILNEARRLSRAKLLDIKCAGSLIRLTYELDGEEGRLTYDTVKGILI